MTAVLYADGELWDSGTPLATSDDIWALQNSIDMAQNEQYQSNQMVLEATSDISNKLCRISDDQFQNAADSKEVSKDILDAVKEQVEEQSKIAGTVQDMNGTLSEIAGKVQEIRVLMEKEEKNESAQEKEIILVEDRGQGDGALLLETTDNQVFKVAGDSSVKTYEVTLNDLHDDLLQLNDNMIYSQLLNFAATLAILGLILGKGLWKNW